MIATTALQNAALRAKQADPRFASNLAFKAARLVKAERLGLPSEPFRVTRALPQRGAVARDLPGAVRALGLAAAIAFTLLAVSLLPVMKAGG